MQTDKMMGKMPAGVNYQGIGWISIQVLPPSVVKALEAGAVVTLELKPGTGDVRMIGQQFGKAIEIPAVKP
jgi:hypothetical protein